MEKIYCKKHEGEPFTVFCAQGSCMLELCASCVADHAEYHSFMKTKPHFQNIKQAISSASQRIGTQKNNINQLKNRVKNLMDRSERQRIEVSDMFRVVKSEVMSTVERVLDEMEENICYQIEQEMMKNNLGTGEVLERMYSSICQQSVSLHEINKQLSRNMIPGLLKQANIQIIPDISTFYQKIEKQIARNQLFKAQANFQAFSLKDIESSLKQLITISFSIPANKNHEPLKSRSNNSFMSRSPQRPIARSPISKQAISQFSKTDPYGMKSFSRSSGLELISKAKQNKVKTSSDFFKPGPF